LTSNVNNSLGGLKAGLDKEEEESLKFVKKVDLRELRFLSSFKEEERERGRIKKKID
jgi:hypothetical protein